MCALRFGSYSMPATFAGMPRLSRLQSISRYFCLWQPPMKREVMRSLLLRPPVFDLPLFNAFSERDLVMSSNEACVWNRMPGDVGLYLFVAIVFLCSRLGLHALDELGRLLAGLEPHVGLAPVAALAGPAAHAFHFTANVEEADL